MPDPEPNTQTGGSDLFGWVSSIAEKGAAFTLMVAGLFMTVVPTVGIFTDVWSKDISLGIYVAALVAGVAAMASGGIIAVITEQSIRKETLVAYQTTLDRTSRTADLYERLFGQIVKADTATQASLIAQLPQVIQSLSQSYAAPAPLTR